MALQGNTAPRRVPDPRADGVRSGGDGAINWLVSGQYPGVMRHPGWPEVGANYLGVADRLPGLHSLAVHVATFRSCPGSNALCFAVIDFVGGQNMLKCHLFSLSSCEQTGQTSVAICPGPNSPGR